MDEHHGFVDGPDVGQGLVETLAGFPEGLARDNSRRQGGLCDRVPNSLGNQGHRFDILPRPDHRVDVIGQDNVSPEVEIALLPSGLEGPNDQHDGRIGLQEVPALAAGKPQAVRLPAQSPPVHRRNSLGHSRHFALHLPLKQAVKGVLQIAPALRTMLADLMRSPMQETNNRCGIALVGCGVVGGAVATLLTRDRQILQDRTRLDTSLRYIVDVNHDHARELGLDESLYTDDLSKALADPDVRVVVELVGGTTIAREITEQALKAGKHVVTANKALLAHAGADLYALARECGVSLAFEASCAGGIPIVRALADGLIANRIDALYGIVNGTCNFILSSMVQEGLAYENVLAQAQADGLAEADPTLDVSGEDSAHKLTILAGLAFGCNVDFQAISVEGIDRLQLLDIQQGQSLGYVIKLLAIAQRQGGGLCLRVRPVFIDIEHPLAWVSGPFNAVSVYGHATGHTMYYGRGAGGMPTASAVVADILSVAQGLWPKLFDQLAIWADRCPPARQLPIEEVRSRYYIRMPVEDRPGVFAQIGRVFAEHEISIASLLQPEMDEEKQDDTATIVITTHVSREGAVRAALAQCEKLPSVRAVPVCIGIVDEHPEKLWSEGNPEAE